MACVRAGLAAALDWWAAPFYAWGYLGALVAIGLSWSDSTRLALALALAAVTFLHATWRFGSRTALLVAGALAHGAVLAAIDAAGWLAYPAWAALAFLPVTVVMALLGLAVETWRREGALLPQKGEGWKVVGLGGWSRPLYFWAAVDLYAGQVLALTSSEPGAVVSAAHALLLALLATAWVQPALALAAAGLGVVALFQGLAWAGAQVTVYPVALALLALTYGLAGYGLAYALPGERRARLWSGPLEWAAMGLSALALLGMAWIGLSLGRLVLDTFLGRPVVLAAFAPQLRMAMWVLALSGLLYLATSVVRRQVLIGYGAVALLLAAWALWWRFFLGLAEFQWYAVPAGFYLFAAGWLEARRGHSTLARWIDRVGMLTWLGTAWWQSLPGVHGEGWRYALLMGVEGLLLLWWGSARRQKRFLYAGALAVVLDAVTQSIEPLLSANRWIVFGLAGLLLVGIAVLVERRL